MPNVQKQLNMANPAPLGLLGFAMTTILLNLHNAGIFPLGSMILAMGLCYGGIAQIVAGVLEWKKENTFGMTAFISYGFFWLSLVGILILPKLGLATAPTPIAMTAYLGIWGLFTLVMFIATLKLPVSLQFVFASLTILFFLLALGDLTGNTTITKIAGYEGIFCGLTAFYTASAQILNGVYKKTILPV